MKPIMRELRMTYLMLVPATDEHFNSPVALPALFGLVSALQPLLAERSRLDLVTRHARLHEGFLNGGDAALAEGLVVRICAARISVAIDADLRRRILVQIRRDCGHLARLVSPDVGLVEIEQNIVELRPARCGGARCAYHALHTRGTLGAARAHRPRHSHRTTRTHRTSRTHRAGLADLAGGTIEFPTGITADGSCTAAGGKQRDHGIEHEAFHRC